ncbi:stage IV sporulation protein FA [Seinonella peptonophila]|uniref:Stage IV sporulation protein FA n=1 Tax=Seinonella peptonophila TaxID=112248 RepID=A0A1M4TTB2_9BACL|nr:M23 family metallopeptidase [Seinonella peptonophila]SHE47711.1 stage IV sporulation protein FA [Seinonella peptonophila]
MQPWENNIKKRRAEQLQLIQQGFSNGIPPASYPAPWQEIRSSEVKWDGQAKHPSYKKRSFQQKLLIQTVISILLFAFTYTIYQSNSIKAHQVQYWINTAVNQDFQFSALSQWYREKWGNQVAFLPVFSPKKSTTTKRTEFMTMPVRGEVVMPFDPKRKGILLKTQKNAVVTAPAAGWVVFAGLKKGLGQTVVIQHSDGRQTWFGFLKELHVKKKQWIRSSDLLGKVMNQDRGSFVYIAYRKSGRFIDPVEVIPFAV